MSASYEAAISEIAGSFTDHAPILRSPDGWFGRPMDNCHRLTSVTVRDDGLLAVAALAPGRLTAGHLGL